MNLIDIDCIFCEKESKRIEWVENGFTGKRCDCGLLFVSPRPDLSDILNLYLSDEAIVSLKPSYNTEFASRVTSRHRLKLLRQFISKGSLLEIGCANGYFLDESRRAGFEPYGIELNLREAKFIKEELTIPVENNPFTESSFGGIHFDVICHFDVISHFYDPLFEFKKFNNSLNNSGILFFETGNGGDLSKWWLRFIGHLQYPQHLFLFSKKNVEQLCHETGFEIIRTYRYSILFQIAAIKIIQLFRKNSKEIYSKKEKTTAVQSMAEVSKTYSWWRGLFFKSLILMSFFVRYKIGRIIPKIGPQTILYIAKRHGQSTQNK